MALALGDGANNSVHLFWRRVGLLSLAHEELTSLEELTLPMGEVREGGGEEVDWRGRTDVGAVRGTW